MFAVRCNKRFVSCILKVNCSFATEMKEKNWLQISDHFTNRNPRNLERMRIGYKPDGYHLEKSGRNFWHKLDITTSGRYVRATIEHFENGKILEASTSEWALKRQLYKCKDMAAYYNLGRVLAERCLQSGLTEVYCGIPESPSQGKVTKFLDGMREGGVNLQEPPQFKPSRPWDLHRHEKPWEVAE